MNKNNIQIWISGNQKKSKKLHRVLNIQSASQAWMNEKGMTEPGKGMNQRRNRVYVRPDFRSLLGIFQGV
jgi:hypothetical protein